MPGPESGHQVSGSAPWYHCVYWTAWHALGVWHYGCSVGAKAHACQPVITSNSNTARLLHMARLLAYLQQCSPLARGVPGFALPPWQVACFASDSRRPPTWQPVRVLPPPANVHQARPCLPAGRSCTLCGASSLTAPKCLTASMPPWCCTSCAAAGCWRSRALPARGTPPVMPTAHLLSATGCCSTAAKVGCGMPVTPVMPTGSWLSIAGAAWPQRWDVCYFRGSQDPAIQALLRI